MALDIAYCTTSSEVYRSNCSAAEHFSIAHTESLYHDAAMPLSVLRKRTAAMIWHHESVRTRVYYLGHILRITTEYCFTTGQGRILKHVLYLGS